MIALLQNFYTDRPGGLQSFTLIHEGIHLLGQGALPDSVVISDLGLVPKNMYDTDVITEYIAGGCTQ